MLAIIAVLTFSNSIYAVTQSQNMFVTRFYYYYYYHHNPTQTDIG